MTEAPPARWTPDRSTWALIVAIVYALSPVDLITDMAPLIGLADDIGVGAVGLALVGWWRRGGTWRDLAPLLVALGYDLLPVDLLPDVVPLAGRADDLVVSLLGLAAWWWRRRAGDKPDAPG